eukprot:s438_g25.t1
MNVLASLRAPGHTTRKFQEHEIRKWATCFGSRPYDERLTIPPREVHKQAFEYADCICRWPRNLLREDPTAHEVARELLDDPQTCRAAALWQSSRQDRQKEQPVPTKSLWGAACDESYVLGAQLELQ